MWIVTMWKYFALCLLTATALLPQERVERYAVFEARFEAAGAPANSYTSINAEAEFVRPDGASWKVPLFWDGQRTWKLRVSPDLFGKWQYKVVSNDTGLRGQSGAFECVESKRAGGVRPSRQWPSHFERQNGSPMWFLGDTAWGYFTDSPTDKHHRPQAEHHAKTRASQGFNVIHCMMMSEQGVGNNNGPPFEDIAAERINPRYWQEVDERLAFANRQGLTVGLAIAWGDKRKVEPFAWRKLPTVEARKRYARYAAARYSAYDVYFLLSGEWHAEIRTRENASAEEVFREFVEIGSVVDAADPHGRMIGIHPMTAHGSVREFAVAPWMSFADYQQNYRDLHARILSSRFLRGPVVNSEYGYHLRDADGDGLPDKDNSYSTEDMRFASWDIVMGGGYLVTGFGTTYFAGHRDPGPFDVDAAKNDEWESQIGHIRKFFEQVEWWKLIPADELLQCATPRGRDRQGQLREGGRKGAGIQPPATTYWAMAIPGQAYVVYVRGLKSPVELSYGARPRKYSARQFNARTGEFTPVAAPSDSGYKYQPPDEHDWLVLLEAEKN
jgi:hypothetical protein